MKELLIKHLKNLYRVELLFLSLYVCGIFTQGISSLKYIGLYGAIILFLMLLYLDKVNIFNSYQLGWKKYRLLIMSFSILLVTIFISVLFTYGDISEMIRSYRVEFLNITIFSFIVFGMLHQKKLFLYFFFMIVLSLVSNVLYYGWNYLQINPSLNFSMRLDRSFSFLFDFSFPFAVITLFIVKNKIVKTSLLIILFIGLFELILTGARGGWISTLFSLFLIVSILYWRYTEYRKKIIGSILVFLIFVSGLFYYAYEHSSLVKNRIDVGLYTSGRDVIIKERLPIFLEHGNFFIGIGGPGNNAFEKLLNDQKAPIRCGKQLENTYLYCGDEPFFLQTFYREGIVGLIVCLWILILMIRLSWRNIKYTDKYTVEFYFSVALFSSFFSYYFIRGLVELRNFTMLFVFVVLLVTLTTYIESKMKK